MKKLFSLLLSILLVINTFPAFASSQYDEYIDIIKESDDVDFSLIDEERIFLAEFIEYYTIFETIFEGNIAVLGSFIIMPSKNSDTLYTACFDSKGYLGITTEFPFSDTMQTSIDTELTEFLSQNNLSDATDIKGVFMGGRLQMCAYDITHNGIRYFIPIHYYERTSDYNPKNIDEYNLVIGKAYTFDEFAEILKKEDVVFDEYQAQKREEETYAYDDDGEMVIHIGVTPAPTTEPAPTTTPIPTVKPTATPEPEEELPTPTPEIDEEEPTPKPTAKPTPSPVPTPIVETSFTDINGHWAEDTIIKWENEGIINGYDDNTFKPDNSVTRAEFAKIITLAFELKKAESINYIDVDIQKWYYPYIERSGKLIPIYSMVKTDENVFLPDENAIRIHVAEALTELKLKTDNLNINIPETDELRSSLNSLFKDEEYKNQTDVNAERIMKYTWLSKETGIMEGDDNGYFRPYDNITRAELITIIDRIFSE